MTSPAPSEKFTLAPELARSLPPLVLAIVALHVGAARAITARAIADTLKADPSNGATVVNAMRTKNADRLIRAAVQPLRLDGHDICSNGNGFFIGTAQAESDYFLRWIHSKIMAHWDVYHTYARIVRRKYPTAQLPLPIIEDDPKQIRLDAARAIIQAPASRVVQLLPSTADPRLRFSQYCKRHDVSSQVSDNLLALHKRDYAAALDALIEQTERAELYEQSYSTHVLTEQA